MGDTSERYSSIDEYIQAFPEQIRKKLLEIRQLISYRMPAFYLNGNLVYFAAHSRHIGFYPTSSGISQFADEIRQYKSSKGAVQFPIDAPLPADLIRRIVEFRAEENRRKSKRQR